MSLISGATNQSYTVTASGDYALIVTSNGCSDTSACYSVISVGIIENDFDHKLLLDPNLTSGDFSIDLGQSYNIVNTSVFDLNGNLIQSKSFKDSQLLNLKLEVSAGLYLLIIQSDDEQYIIRFVKD